MVKNNRWNVQQSLSDFRVIKYNGKHFTPSQFNQFHEECFNFIQDELKKPHPGKTIVATHHVPTFFNYPELFRGDDLNEAFAVELFPFIEDSEIDYWIYGHHHSNIPDFSIGKTRLLTNQLGYVRIGDTQGYSSGKFISV